LVLGPTSPVEVHAYADRIVIRPLQQIAGRQPLASKTAPARAMARVAGFLL
jgi:hypothetical protein